MATLGIGDQIKISPGKPAPDSSGRNLTADEAELVYLCSPSQGIDGFVRFCSTFVKIMDKGTGQPAPFELWPRQIELAAQLVAGEWMIVLKARQLGVTTLICAFAYWNLVYRPLFTATIVNQSKEYAEEFVDEKMRYIHENMPEFFRMSLLTDTKTKMVLGHTHKSKITACAGTDKAARSTTGNLLVCDEAAYIERLAACLKAGEPTMEKTKGQVLILSTSQGPTGDFYKRCKIAIDGKGKYAISFMDWKSDPHRTQEWYDKEAIAHADDPSYMNQEYPETVEEAFMASGGRIYPGFRAADYPAGHRLHIPLSELEAHWPRYRGLDWGETASATVCLWVVAIPSSRRRVTYDPSCTNFEREMLSYSRKEDTEKIITKDDHCPDAFRYIVASFQLEKVWVHVYRELYILDPKSKMMTSQKVFTMIKKLSGYVLLNEDDPDAGYQRWQSGDHVEEYEGSVFDKARPILENEAIEMDLYFEAHRSPTGDPMNKEVEVEAGITMVYGLIMDALPRSIVTKKTDAQIEKGILAKPDVIKMAGVSSTVPLVQRILRNQQKRDRAGRRFKNNRLRSARRRFGR